MLNLGILPVGRASHWTHHETSTPYRQGSRKENVKCLIGWLLEANQESPSAAGPPSLFCTSKINAQASDLAGEQANGFSVQNMMLLELYLSVLKYTKQLMA